MNRLNGKIYPQIAIIIQSSTDLPAIKPAEEFLKKLGIPYRLQILSPYRTPSLLQSFCQECEREKTSVFIAASGGTNYLATFIASQTPLPVIALPLKEGGQTHVLSELAAAISTMETPKCYPILTVGFGDAFNAAFAAVQILATRDERVKQIIYSFREEENASKAQQNREHLSTTMETSSHNNMRTAAVSPRI